MLLRIVAEHLSQLWGQQAIVINQPGGAGAVAIRAVAASPPDGHSLYMALASNFIALPELQASFPVDVVRDTVPIGYIGEHPMVIAASSSLGVNTLPEFIALAKKRKGELNIAAGNRGSILHLAGEWLRMAGGHRCPVAALSGGVPGHHRRAGRPRAWHDRRHDLHEGRGRGRPDQAARGGVAPAAL